MNQVDCCFPQSYTDCPCIPCKKNLTRHSSSQNQARVSATLAVQRNHAWQRKISPRRGGSSPFPS